MCCLLYREEKKKKKKRTAQDFSRETSSTNNKFYFVQRASDANTTTFSSTYAIIIIELRPTHSPRLLIAHWWKERKEERDRKSPPAHDEHKVPRVTSFLERLRSGIHISCRSAYSREREKESHERRASTAPVKLGHLYFKSWRASMDRLSSLNAKRYIALVSLYEEKSPARIRQESFIHSGREENESRTFSLPFVSSCLSFYIAFNSPGLLNNRVGVTINYDKPQIPSINPSLPRNVYTLRKP